MILKRKSRHYLFDKACFCVKDCSIRGLYHALFLRRRRGRGRGCCRGRRRHAQFWREQRRWGWRRRRHIDPFGIDIRVDFSKADVRVHVPVSIVLREHKVHRVAGGLIIEAPLEPRAEKRQLVDQIVDNCVGHLFIARGIGAVVREVVIPDSALVGLNAVIRQVVADLTADQVVIARNITVGIEVVVDVDRRAQRVMAQVLQVGLEARHIGSVLFH